MPDEPRRLKYDPNLPPELRRVLESLRKGADESARLERAAKALGPLLDAVPGSIPIAARGARGHHAATALKFMLGGFALLAPILWTMRSQFTDESQLAAPPSVQQPRSEPASEPLLVPQAVPEVAPEVAPYDTAKSPAPADDKRGQARGDAFVRGRRSPTKARPANVNGAAPSGSTTELVSAPAQATEQSAPVAEPRPEDRPQPTAARVEPKPALPSAAPPPEAELLFDARKAAHQNPALALQLLADHEKHYPNGQLVAEREVLAIETLRRLGRTTEADARLQRFQTRFPHSFHLQRLQR